MKNKIVKTNSVKRKRATIVIPVPGTDGRWLCLTVDGNLKWNTIETADSEVEAKNIAKNNKKYWKKFSDLQVCQHLKAYNESKTK
jgi:hypothetical protein